MDMTWENETRQHKAVKTTIIKKKFKKKKKIYIYIYISFNTSRNPLSKVKGTMHKPESWNVTNQTTKGPKASLIQFLYSFSCRLAPFPSLHIPHFFSFTQSSQSLHLCPSPLLCPKPMTTTNVSSCVGSYSHTSGGVDVFLIIKFVMLCGIIFIAIFF